jgi:ribosomal protein S18 acetylase RimI-like enzyme
VPWSIERFDSKHDIAAFDCGEPSLNLFLQRHALNNARAGLGRTFVAVEPGLTRVLGYFTVSTGSVSFDTVPDHGKKRLPKYPIPTVHVGRLAVDATCQGQGLGETLLVESLRKTASASDSIGVYAVDLIALHDQAKRFYLKYGFTEMLDSPLHLFMPIGTVHRLAKAAEG